MQTANTTHFRLVPRLTSAAESSSARRRKALDRALWQQSQTLFGAHVRARDIYGNDNQADRQRALVEELERQLVESKNLLDTLESQPVESEE